MDPLSIVLGGSMVTGALDSIGLNPISNWNADRDFSKSVDAQRGLTQLSYDLSQRNWESQFNKEARYNRPYEELMRQREAGFNPYVRESAANGTMSMPAQSGSGSAASVNPVPNYVDRYSSAFLDSLRGINQGIVNEKTKDMINAQIQDLIAGAASKDAQAQFTTIQADLERRYGGLLKRRQINKLNAEIQEAFANATKLTEEGRYFDQGVFESLAKEAMNKALGIKYQKEAQLFDLDIRNYGDKLKHLFQLQDAQAGESRAVAGELDVRSEKEKQETENLITDNEYKKIMRDMAQVDLDIKNKTAFMSALADLENKQLVNRELVQSVDRAYKENKLVYLRFIKECIRDGAAAWRDAAMAGHITMKTVTDFINLGLKKGKITPNDLPSGSGYKHPNGSIVDDMYRSFWMGN